MTQQTQYFPLSGGMDLITPAIALKPGRVVAALNYEPVASGYRRLRGFERFDGQTAPSAGGTRANITAVPGVGPVRGVWFTGGNVVAIRDKADLSAGALYLSSASGWDETPIPGYSMRFNSGGTTELTADDDISDTDPSVIQVDVFSVVLTNGAWADGDAEGIIYSTDPDVTGFGVGDPIFIHGTSTNVGTVATAPEANQIPIGGSYRFIEHNFSGDAAGASVYGCNGVARAFEISSTGVFRSIYGRDDDDTPTKIAVHKQALFLGYDSGQIQFSAVGEPLIHDASLGAGTLGIGDDLSDFINVPNALGILGKNSIHVLYGNDSTDYQLETLTREAGALEHTAQRLGEPIYMDNRGIRTLAATQRYGNFAAATISKFVEPLIKDKRIDSVEPSASLVSRSADQYWLFFDDGTGLIVYMGAKEPVILPFDLGITITCACSVEDDGVERIFVGASNGFVYELNKGTSFDGSAIEHYIRLPFNHFGSPQQLKRAHKITIDLEASGTTSLEASVDFDYGSVDGLDAQQFTVTTGGGAIDDLGSNELYFASQIETTAELYVDGVAKNFSLKIGGSTDDEEPHVLTGVTYHVSPRGMDR